MKKKIKKKTKKLKKIRKKKMKKIKRIKKRIKKKIKRIRKKIIKKIKMNNAIRKTLRKTGKSIFNSINKNLRNEKDDENEDLYDKIDEEPEGENEDDPNILRGSTLIGINDFGKNIELFKTKILFQDKNIIDENRIGEAKILRKNWHEVCYVYDDYDMHDVHFEIKAVGLGAFSFFNSCSTGFYIGKDIEILELEINGKRAKYAYNDYCLDFNINLKNLQTAKIYLKYKERPNFAKMRNSERLKYAFFRQEFYGLSPNLSGQMGKYRLILKGSFEIISFKDNFFIQNEQNKKEKEYIWGGKVPPEGKRTLVKLSKNEATWKFNCNTQIIARRGELRNTTLKVPLGFVGGNNDIIKMDYSSPQTKNIVVDEENRIYEIKYKNSGYKTGDFILSGEIKNRCKGGWDVDLTDEMIEAHIPKEDKRDKQILEKIARKIIEDFDKNNKNTMFNFMDYAKIGKWVHKNIKYDLNYSGRTDMTAMDIYNKRVGVCHHMTRLSNALLYSLGYKVIYTNGFACESSAEFDQNSGHAWSLIKINDKWYPFDSTWDILSGKLPVCHVFQGFFGKSTQVIGTDGAIFGNNNVENSKIKNSAKPKINKTRNKTEKTETRLYPNYQNNIDNNNNSNLNKTNNKSNEKNKNKQNNKSINNIIDINNFTYHPKLNKRSLILAKKMEPSSIRLNKKRKIETEEDLKPKNYYINLYQHKKDNTPRKITEKKKDSKNKNKSIYDKMTNLYLRGIEQRQKKEKKISENKIKKENEYKEYSYMPNINKVIPYYSDKNRIKKRK